MWIIQSRYGTPNFYRELEKEVFALIEGEKDLVANLANIAACLYHAIPDLNWTGFYLWKDDELVLGPFQGLPACIRIKSGKGVCGTAFQERNTLKVDDVDAFPGHIACDSASRSELVVPLLKDGICFGVLDLDSPRKSRFSEEDATGLTELMQLVVPRIF